MKQSESESGEVVWRLSRPWFSKHARRRCTSRRLGEQEVMKVIEFGRELHGRDAHIYVVGRKEIARYQEEGVDLRPLEGIHVVCSTDGTVITTYRNRNLDGLRGLNLVY